MLNLKKIILDIDNEKLACEYALAEVNAVILHGAGQKTSRKMNYPIANELIKNGIGVFWRLNVRLFWAR